MPQKGFWFPSGLFWFWYWLMQCFLNWLSSLCLSFASFFKYGSSLPDLSQGTCITVVACFPHFRFSELSCLSPVLASQQAGLLVEENLFGTWTGHSCTMGFDLWPLFDLRIRFLWTITYLLAVLSQILAAREPYLAALYCSVKTLQWHLWFGCHSVEQQFQFAKPHVQRCKNKADEQLKSETMDNTVCC